MFGNKSQKFARCRFFISFWRKLWNSKKQFPLWRTFQRAWERDSMKLLPLNWIWKEDSEWLIVDKPFRGIFKGNPFKSKWYFNVSIVPSKRTKKDRIPSRLPINHNFRPFVCLLVVLVCVLTITLWFIPFDKQININVDVRALGHGHDHTRYMMCYTIYTHSH